MRSSLSAIFLTLAGIAIPAVCHAYDGVNYHADCAEYSQAVHDEISLRFSPLHAGDLEGLVSRCKDDSPLAKGLKKFFEYHSVSERLGPMGQGWDPNTSQTERDAALAGFRKQLDGLIARFKKENSPEFKAALSYMVWQTDDYQYAYTACEIMARAFPSEYDSLKPMTRDYSKEREAWEDTQKQWLAPKAPNP